MAAAEDSLACALLAGLHLERFAPAASAADMRYHSTRTGERLRTFSLQRSWKHPGASSRYLALGLLAFGPDVVTSHRSFG